MEGGSGGGKKRLRLRSARCGAVRCGALASRDRWGWLTGCPRGARRHDPGLGPGPGSDRAGAVRAAPPPARCGGSTVGAGAGRSQAAPFRDSRPPSGGVPGGNGVFIIFIRLLFSNRYAFARRGNKYFSQLLLPFFLFSV